MSAGAPARRCGGARAALLAVLLALGGCGRETPAEVEKTASPAPEEARAAAEPGAAEPPPGARRGLVLAQSGWRFHVDALASAGRSRIEVLAAPATVGAAPLRWMTEADGEIAEGFATDLDADGWPELLLWLREGSAAEAAVLGWRLRGDGEPQALALPPLDGDLAVGWRGRDQLGVQGAHLVRSFPLYRDEDDNAAPSAGFVRVVRYRLAASSAALRAADGDPRGLVVADSALEPIAGTPQADLLAR